MSFKALLKMFNIFLPLNIIQQTVAQFGTHNTKGSICKCFLSVLGTINLSLIVPDLSPSLPGTCIISRFCRYPGASPYRHLYNTTAILKLIQLMMGSQCRVWRLSFELVYLPPFNTTFAAIF